MRAVLLKIAMFTLAAMPAVALAQADLRNYPGKEWPTIGGDWHNTRYSTLDQINPGNVKNLKAAWMVHLGSGLGSKYSMEGTPIVQGGVMYFATGNDDVFALNAKTGERIWEHYSVSRRTTVRCVAAGTIVASPSAKGRSSLVSSMAI